MKDYEKVIIEMIKDGIIPQKAVEKYCPELAENEDERIMEKLVSLITWSTSYSASGITHEDAEEMLSWLEKQSEQKPAEWSDEDEIMRRATLEMVLANPKLVASNILKESVIDWLKSLRTQNTWKPSEEQMEALRYATEKEGCNHVILIGLISDLEKLTE